MSAREDLPSLCEVQQQDDDRDDEEDDEDRHLEGGQVFPLFLQGVAEGLCSRDPRQRKGPVFGSKLEKSYPPDATEGRHRATESGLVSVQFHTHLQHKKLKAGLESGLR